MGKLTTHVLDTAAGAPAAGVAIRLFASGAAPRLLIETRTNADGRCDAPLLEGEAFQAGVYVLDFAIADYFRAEGVTLSEPAFFDHIAIPFGVADASAHYHVPLLVSPYGYSTYRGS